MTLDNYNIFGDEYHLFNMPLSPLPKVLVSFDGMQSVPTLTTPTLTPTTLRTIEETIYELTSEPQNVPFQAGFKPPPLTAVNSGGNNNNNNNTGTSTTSASTLAVINANANPINSQSYELMSSNCSIPGSDSEDSNGSWNDGQLNDDQSTTDTSSAATDSTSYQNGGHGMMGNGSNGVANNFTAALAAVNNAGRSSGQAGNSNTNTSNSATPARRGGGRRPNKAANMSPEEEEKRRIRRERNKLAAARCRKRRVDQTNELTDEVEALTKKGETLKKEIEMLNVTKNQLEYVLQSHRPTCQKVRDDLLSVATCNGLIGPAALLSAGSCSGSGSSHHNNNNSNSNDSSSGTITGYDATLNSTGRSNSPLDLKPVLTDEQLLQHIKHEPQDGALDSGSSLDQDGPTPAKRCPLPNIATLNASLTTPTGPISCSLNTPIVSAPPVSFNAFAGNICNMSSPTLNALNKLPKTRPNTLNVQRPFGGQLQAGVDGKAPTQIQGVPIQTPSTGTFNFDSLMDGGTGLTPVSGPLVPTCSSQNKHPLEMPTPTSEPSKLVSL
ncbi:transcription factor kayak isoform X3 [Drosophila innubila]|uniref:transcription factor kayak isoform X3 n=1 Tax=Drosophila innubila TaxID=198719 RepID=UPI00148B9E1E|nr:transcription factor kayak isoform X3 [Drosophila innubila]